MIVLLSSQHTGASPHVLREVERATSWRAPVLALRIDAIPLSGSLQYFLNASHWLDAGVGPLLPRLVEAGQRRRRRPANPSPCCPAPI